MNAIALAIWMLEVSTVFTLPLKSSVSKTELLKRKARSADGKIGCLQMESVEGEYTFTSEGSDATCGFYLVGLPDQLVEIEFLDFNIDCENRGLMAILDGWELNGQFFPSIEDHPLTMQDRYKLFCGAQGPKQVFVSSQNVALIQSRVVTPGQGYKLRVRFIKSQQPCNIISMFQEGIQTMKNYGDRRNCTVSIIYPSAVRLINVDVGITGKSSVIEGEFGLTQKCELNKYGNDYVEFLGGNGFEISPLNRRGLYCGLQSSVGKDVVVIGCQHTLVRLVSSGSYYNSVSFLYQPPSETEMNLDDPNKCV